MKNRLLPELTPLSGEAFIYLLFDGDASRFVSTTDRVTLQGWFERYQLANREQQMNGWYVFSTGNRGQTSVRQLFLFVPPSLSQCAYEAFCDYERQRQLEKEIAKWRAIIGYRANHAAAATVAGDAESAALFDEEKHLAIEKIHALSLTPETAS